MLVWYKYFRYIYLYVPFKNSQSRYEASDDKRKVKTHLIERGISLVSKITPSPFPGHYKIDIQCNKGKGGANTTFSSVNLW